MIRVLMGEQQIMEVGKDIRPLPHAPYVPFGNPAERMAIFMVNAVDKYAEAIVLDQNSRVGDKGYPDTITHAFNWAGSMATMSLP